MKTKKLLRTEQIYNFLAPRAHTFFILVALVYTLGCKFAWACKKQVVSEYPFWILTDIAVLLSIDVIFSLLCYYKPKRLVYRTTTLLAVLVCTWSVMNACWLMRNGWQILPTVLIPLKRDPVNALLLLGENYRMMLFTASVLLVPSPFLLFFFFYVFVKPKLPNYNHKFLERKIIISGIIIVLTASVYGISTKINFSQHTYDNLRSNCQVTAFVSLFRLGSYHLAKNNSSDIQRQIPALDKIDAINTTGNKLINHNVVIVVLEGVQYKLTSLSDKGDNLTPYLLNLAEKGAQFTNTRSCLTHTTKALFGLLTGRLPSVSQDLAEAVPARKSYASLATILKHKLNFRTVFFQSAKGNFESRPSLVYNLGFDSFFSRDEFGSEEDFLGYLACDEFSMLKPITDWIKSDSRAFLLVILCSVTHDPYEVPEWFAEHADDPLERYKQTIAYTDKFIEALDVEFKKLGLIDEMVFCVVGDHGEAFGEHGLFGHERIAFDEALRIPFVIRAPYLLEPKTKVDRPVTSTDLTPTILSILGFQTTLFNFDGIDVLRTAEFDRKMYFSGWMQQSPAGFIRSQKKFVYDAIDGTALAYNLIGDPLELKPIELDEQQVLKIGEDITKWRNNSFFSINQQKNGQMILFDNWLCRWTDRIATVKFQETGKD